MNARDRIRAMLTDDYEEIDYKIIKAAGMALGVYAMVLAIIEIVEAAAGIVI